MFQREKAAAARVVDLLGRPDIPGQQQPYSDGEHFDPWELLPCLFGSYSSAFDDLAISVLTDVRDGSFIRNDLASEMFREMLCKADLCYGTSPRTCFPTEYFRALLPRLIERWKRYAELMWDE